MVTSRNALRTMPIGVLVVLWLLSMSLFTDDAFNVNGKVTADSPSVLRAPNNTVGRAQRAPARPAWDILPRRTVHYAPNNRVLLGTLSYPSQAGKAEETADREGALGAVQERPEVANPVSAVQTVSSTTTSCLRVGPNWGSPDSPTIDQDDVLLVWDGTATEARLVLSQSGADYWQDILVNGTKVGHSEVDIFGDYCDPSLRLEISLDPSLINKGKNIIAIKDVVGTDDWSAANAQIAISGNIAGAAISDVLVASSYDNTLRRFSVLIPAAYDGYSPFPLIVVLHGWNDNAHDGIDWFGEMANRRGFILVSPDMHGERTGGETALASRAAQHDILDAIGYVVSNYNVDTSRIYLTGVSMGGMTAATMAAKYPDVFAAAVEFKGPTDLIAWYDESPTWRQDAITTETGGTPSQVPFEYQRRSALQMARNFKHLPFAIVHGTTDTTVLPHHASDLFDAISAFGPDKAIIRWYEGGHTESGEYGPDWAADFMAPYRKNLNPPDVEVRTDESKKYYWLEIGQSGGDHWTKVSAWQQSAPNTVQTVVTDTEAVTVTFDLSILGFNTTASYDVDVRDLLAGGTSAYHQIPSGGKMAIPVGSGQHALRLTDPASGPIATPTPTRTPIPMPYRLFLPIVISGGDGG